MNGTMATTNGGRQTLTETVAGVLRRYLGGRRGLILLAVAALGAGAYLNWGWLVAAGVAPLLLILAPCAVMCALGMCMNKTGDQSGSTESKAAGPGADAALSGQNPEAKPSAMIVSVKADERP